MNTRNFVLLGTGMVIGYLLVGIINKNKLGSGVGKTGLPDTSSQTIPPDTVSGSQLNNGLNDTTGTSASVIYGSNSNQANLQNVKETLVDPILTLCEENWNKFAQTKRFGSAEQAKSTHDNFITSCLAKLQ